MNNRTTMAFATFCVLLGISQPGEARPVHASDDWSGTWRLDLAHSRFSGAAPRGETRTVDLSNDRMSVRSTVVDASGKAMRFRYSVTLDGRFHPLIGNPDGDSIAMRLVDPSKVSIEVRRDGKLAATAATQVSRMRLVMDRKRLKLSGSPSEDVLVYDRVP